MLRICLWRGKQGPTIQAQLNKYFTIWYGAYQAAIRTLSWAAEDIIPPSCSFPVSRIHSFWLLKG